MELLKETKKYKITIEEIVTQEYETTKEVLTEKRHYTEEELNNEYNYIRTSPEKYLKEVFGSRIALARDTTKTSIYEQIVEVNGFNIVTVIRAVNENPTKSFHTLYEQSFSPARDKP